MEGKRRTNWPLNEQWGRFIGRNRKEIQLTSEPKPYTIERTLNWLDVKSPHVEDGKGIGSAESDNVYTGYGTECTVIRPA